MFIDPKEKDNWDKFELIKDEKLPLWAYKSQDSNLEVVSLKVGDALKKKLLSSKAYAWCLWLAYNQFKSMGIPEDRIRLRQHLNDEKAFYADDAWDIEIKLNSLDCNLTLFAIMY